MRRQFGYLLATALVASAVMVSTPAAAAHSGAAAESAVLNAAENAAENVATNTSLGALEGASGFMALEPSRLVDTRGSSVVGAGVTLDVGVLGVGGVPLSGVDAVVLNVTVTGPSVGGWSTVFQSGVSRPLASNVNFAAGETVANLVIAKVGVGGKVSIYNAFGTANYIVDVEGWFGSGKPVYYGTDSSWRFVPGDVVLAPGESKVVELVQNDAVGDATGSALPPGVTFPTTGAAGGVIVEPLGGPRVRVTAGSAIDTVVVGAKIPGWDIGPSLGVTIARIRPETVQLTDDQILFPQTDLPNGVDPSTVLPPGVDRDGPGPFTWQQYQDRLNLPTDSMASVTDVLAAEGVEYWYPVVLRGPAPAVGAVVLGIEGNALLGKVIEPAGLSSLTVDGFSLVTIQIVGPVAAYLDLHYDLSYEDLIAIGAVPAPYLYESAAADIPADAAGPRRTSHQPTDASPPTEPPDTGQVSGSSSNTQQAPARSFGSWANDCKNSILSNPSFSAALVEVQPALSIEIKPIIDFVMDVTSGETGDVSMRAGISASATIQMKVKVQLAINTEATCPPVPFASLEVAFPGVLAPVMNFVLRGEITMKLGLKVEGGPRLTYGYGCTFGMELAGGFKWSPINGFDTLTNDIFNKSCSETKEGSWGVTSDGVGLLIEPSIGVPVSTPVGVRIGGSVAEAIGKVISWVAPSVGELGLVVLLKAEVSPVIKFTWENVANALANKDAKAGLGAELSAKAFLELESVLFMAAKFVVKPSGRQGLLEIPILELKLPLGSLYAPLKKARFEVKVNDEASSEVPAVYVQKDDNLLLQSVMAPATGGFTGGAPPQLTEGWLYRRVGNTWERSTIFGPVLPLVSSGAERVFGVTMLRITHPITKAICDDLRDEPVEFALVGNAPMTFLSFSLPAPAWGGTFKIQCVEGMVKWSPTEIVDLKPLELRRPVSIFTSGVRDDTLTFKDVPSWIEFAYDPIDVVKKVDGEQEIPLYLRIKDDGSPPKCEQRSGTILVESKNRGAKGLLVKEDEKCYLRFDPVSVTGPGEVMADLHTEGFRQMYLPLAMIRAQLPSWLHLNWPVPNTSTELVVPASNGQMQTYSFQLTVDAREPKCVDQPARVHILEVNDADRGHAVLTIRDPKVDKRDDCGFKFTPNQLPGFGLSMLSLRDDRVADTEEDGWQIDPASVPKWLTVNPLSGALHNGEADPVVFAGEPPYDPCIGRSEIHFPIFATLQLFEGPTLDARMVLVYPAKDPVDCENHTARSAADPHMVSFDGVRWEAQTLGEYVYVQTQPGAPTPMRLVARHQPTNPAYVDESRAPTSVTAVAFEVGANLVEIYSDESIYIDHVLQVLADGVPVAVSGDLSVVRTGHDVRLDAKGMTVTVTPHDGMLDTSVSAGSGMDIRGALGIPDGDQLNDFTGADGTVYLPADITNLVLPQFTDFNQSWRLTDQADSPFTRQISLARFGKASPGFDQALFDQWGPQADTLIAAVATVCDNGASVSVRKRYSVALELSLGTPLSSIEEYLCHYGVQGVAAVDGQPVPGLTVTVDGYGFKKCVTTTGPDGSYLCMVAPDSTEANGIAPALPLALDVVGTWTGRPGVAAQTTAYFPSLAPTEGSPLLTSADLALDAGSVPLLDVSGVASRDGAPLGGDQSFTVEAFDGASTRVGLFNVTAAVDPDTGAFSFRRALPGTAVRARVVFDVNWPVFERFTGEFAGLTLGANPVAFDLAYVVPRLTVAGTVTDGSVGVAGPITIEVHSTSTGGGLLEIQRATVNPDPATGAYTTTIALPRRAVSAQAFMIVPPLAEPYPSVTVPLVAGPNAVALNVVHNPPVVDVHGMMRDEQGNPLTGSFSLITSFFDVNGTLLNTSNVGLVPDSGGVYSLPRTGRVGAVSVEATVLAGVAGEQFSSGRVAVVPGANSLQLDVTLAPVQVSVSGSLVDSGGAALPGPITMYAIFRDLNGEPLGFETASVVPDLAGAYSVQFVGHRKAVSVRLLANLGVGAEQYEQIVGGLVGGINHVVFDVGHNPPVLNVEGTLVDSTSGNPLPGPISIGVEFSQPNGTFVGFNTGYATVTPSALDGSYSFSMAGPHTATKARLTAYLGQNGETVRLDVPVLVPGANAVTFNAGFSAPVVTMTGTMLRTGGAPLAPNAWVTLRSVDAGNGELGSTRFLVNIAADGTYSFTRTLPQGTKSAEATVETSEFVSDWQSSGMRTVVNGSQTLFFDVLLEPVQLQISGTMTKAPGQELAGPVQVGVTAMDASGAQLVYRQRVAMPAVGSGAYTFTLTLPMRTHHVDLIAFVGSPLFGFEQERLTVNGIVPGALTTATLNVVHAPVTLAVSGTASVAGVLNSGFIEVKATATVPGQANPLVVTLYPQASNGAYSANLVLPDGATAATVQVTPLDGANTFSSVQTNLLPNETRNVTIDFDDAPSTLTVSGTMQMFGEAAQSGNLVVRARGTDGGQLSERTIYLALGADGSYSATVPLPTGTTQASVIATAGADLYVTTTQTFEFTSLVQGANLRTIDIDSILLELEGTLTLDGSPLVVTDPLLTFATTGTRGGQPFSYSSSADYETFYTLGSGSFLYSLIVPGDITDATVSIVGVSTPAPTYVFSGLTPGSYRDTWVTNLDSTVALRSFTVNGTMLNAGTPWNVGDMDVVMTPYAFDAADANTPTPWTNLGAVTATVSVDPTLGTWSWTGPLPTGTTMVTLEQRPFAMQRGYVQTYVLPAGDTPIVETMMHDFGTTELSFLDQVYTAPSCLAPTLMVEYELWAFAVEPVDKSGDPSTWAGAVPLGATLVVPDLSSTLVSLSVNAPSTTTFVQVEIRPSPLYAPGIWNSSVGYGLTIDPDGYYGFGANWEFTCV